MNRTSAAGTAGASRVVVVGGGYAGVIAVNRLWGSLTAAERARVTITLVNPSDRFVHRLRLHEHAAGQTNAVLPVRSMIPGEVRLRLGTAVLVDAAARTLRIRSASGEEDLAYDWLVYAVGSRPSAAIPGAVAHALPIGDVSGASAIRDRLQAREDVRVVVIGGGPAGVETAAELAEAYPRATVMLLSAGPLLPRYRPAARRGILRSLRRLGVQVSERMPVAEVTAGGVRLADGTDLDAGLVVCAAGFEVPGLARRSGLPVDGQGRLLVDERLECVADARIVGAGDAVRPPDAVAAHLLMGARVALPLGGAAAGTVLARLRGEEPEPISIGLLGPSLSLGRRGGYIQPTRADDSPLPFALTGRAGAAVKALVCRLTIDLTRKEREHPGAYRVPRGPARPGTPGRGASSEIGTPSEPGPACRSDNAPISDRAIQGDAPGS